MRNLLAGVASGLFLSVASSAFAQDPPLPPPLEPESPSAPTAIADSTCRLGEHDGIDQADARTAASLLCNEIARLGPPAGARYHVSLGKLGALIIYSVTREGDTPDVTADVRALRLHGVEEASVAAPRLADAIVHGTKLDDAEKFGDAVGDGTGRPGKRAGSVHFSLGLLGNLPPLDQGIGPAPGIDLHVHYETKEWELGGGIRFGGGRVDQSAPTMGFFMAEMGGRYFFDDGDAAPYLGGGLAWDYLNLSLPNQFSGDNAGLGAFVDGGIEVLRTYHTHLSFGVRADLPFFSLNGNTSCNLFSTAASPCGRAMTYYYWPVSIEARLTF